MVRSSLILAALVVSGALSAFSDVASANAAFRAGQYDLALEEAAGQRSADAHALRARAILAKVMCSGREPELAALKDALAAAEAALKLDADHGEGRLQKAITL